MDIIELNLHETHHRARRTIRFNKIQRSILGFVELHSQSFTVSRMNKGLLACPDNNMNE